MWLILSFEMFWEASDLGFSDASEIFGRWKLQAGPRRLWGPHKDRVDFCLEELALL